MATNLTRFRKDLDRLLREGDLLQIAMERSRESIRKSIVEKYGDEARAEETLKKVPNFKRNYDGWYSECLSLLRQLLPDRVGNFVALYEKPKGRKSIQYGDYVIQDFLESILVETPFAKVGPSAALPKFEQQLAILKGAERRFESSLFEIRQIVQANLFDSEIEAARELFKHGFLRAAGAVAGVVVEKHLLQVCEDHSIKVAKRNPGIADLNELLKSHSVVDLPQWRHITMLGDLRNLCDHNKAKEPTPTQVTDLIDGADKVLKTVA